MNRTIKFTLLLTGGLLLLLLLTTVPFGFIIATESLTLANWPERVNFQPVMLWPEPEETPHIFGPTYLEGPNYVELVYGNTDPGVVHTLFQSDSFDHFFEPDGLMKLYIAERDDVTTRQVTLTLDGKEVETEVRRNENEPDRGITLFRLGGTYVVHHWQYVSESEALALLERDAHLVEPDDTELIQAFDQRLQERAAEATARRTVEAASQ